MNVTIVDSVPHIARLWPQVEPLLQRAIDQSAGETTMDAVKLRLVEQDLKLIVGEVDDRVEIAWVVSIVQYDNYPALRVVLVGGENLEEWLPVVVEALDKVCRHLGLAQIEIFGRPGFTRTLRQFSDHTYTVMVRRVPCQVEEKQPRAASRS